MTTHIALIRGINVGTAKRVAMGDLREMLSGLGYSDVRTLLNSGNAVLRSEDSPKMVAEAISRGLAGSPRTVRGTSSASSPTGRRQRA